MSEQWFLKTTDAGKVQGPYPREKFDAYASEGRLRPDMLVSTDNKNWIKVSSSCFSTLGGTTAKAATKSKTLPAVEAVKASNTRSRRHQKKRDNKNAILLSAAAVCGAVAVLAVVHTMFASNEDPYESQQAINPARKPDVLQKRDDDSRGSGLGSTGTSANATAVKTMPVAQGTGLPTDVRDAIFAKGLMYGGEVWRQQRQNDSFKDTIENNVTKYATPMTSAAGLLHPQEVDAFVTGFMRGLFESRRGENKSYFDSTYSPKGDMVGDRILPIVLTLSKRIEYGEIEADARCQGKGWVARVSDREFVRLCPVCNGTGTVAISPEEGLRRASEEAKAGFRRANRVNYDFLVRRFAVFGISLGKQKIVESRSGWTFYAFPNIRGPAKKVSLYGYGDSLESSIRCIYAELRVTKDEVANDETLLNVYLGISAFASAMLGEENDKEFMYDFGRYIASNEDDFLAGETLSKTVDGRQIRIGLDKTLMCVKIGALDEGFNIPE